MRDPRIGYGASVGRPLALHANDPPRSVFSLPRIIKNIDDDRRVLDIVDSKANGLTLCSGTLGSDLHNDVLSFINGLRPL
jgi:mannonate dehydratase